MQHLQSNMPINGPPLHGQYGPMSRFMRVSGRILLVANNSPRPMGGSKPKYPTPLLHTPYTIPHLSNPESLTHDVQPQTLSYIIGGICLLGPLLESRKLLADWMHDGILWIKAGSQEEHQILSLRFRACAGISLGEFWFISFVFEGLRI